MARLTIFLGAFLSFLVQPLFGNTLLPAFGGVASVWNGCLAGFQILLVGGYFYAHCVSSRKFKPALHCSLVAISSLGLVAIGFGARSPWAVMPLVAIPFVLLAANSSLVQALSGGRYSLYSVSNLGSFLGLFAYPFVFELLLPLKWQWALVAALVVAYAALLFFMSRGKIAAPTQPTPAFPLSAVNARLPSSPRTYFALSFASCFLLNAVTAHLGADITPLPLLWVVLLGVYLLSYVIAFTERGSRRRGWISISAALVALYATLRLVLVGGDHFVGEVVTGTLVLLLGGIVIHSKLYRIRPPAAELTWFYLFLALGGACGGAFCSFAVPHLSVTVAEYPVALAMVWAAAIGAKRLSGKLPTVLTAVIIAALGLYCQHVRVKGDVLARYRNEYGTGEVVRRPVKLADGSQYLVHDFRCNATTHGLEILRQGALFPAPSAYYTPEGGGDAILRHPKYAAAEPMRVAVLGMGMGTLAAYARLGDTYRMYEINPAVKDFALSRRLFTFLSGAKGNVEIVVDDARKALEREREESSPRYDVLIVDVFNGDAIPPHLATREAFELFRDRLAPGGILALHLTNWHLDLLPLVKAEARELDWEVLAVDALPSAVSAGSRWAFLAPRTEGAAAPTLAKRLYDPRRQEKIDLSQVRDVKPLTDESHSLLPFLRLF